MKKLRSISVLLILVLILSSCSYIKNKSNFDFTEYIQTPKNNYLSLKGTWKLKEYKATSADNSIQDPIVEVGDRLYIRDRLFAFGSRYTVFPQYSSKYVNYSTYMAQNYIIDPEVNYSEENIYVLRITDIQNFAQEIIKVSDSEIALSYNSYIYKFELESEDVSENVLDYYNNLYADSSSPTTEQKVSNDVTAIIGIKTLKNSSSDEEEYEYSSILIRKKKDSNIEVYKIENLLIPRDDNFWKLDYSYDNNSESNFLLYPVSKGPKDDSAQLLSDRSGRNITYMNGDYISFKKFDYYALGDTNNYVYELRDFNTFTANQTLSVSDIAGENGLDEYNSFIDSRVRFYENNFGASEDYIIPRNPSNIGLERSLNEWNYMTTVEIYRNGVDYFNISKLDLVPLIDVVGKEPQTSSQKIKGKVTNATQAFTFPNNDYIIIKTDNEIYICEKKGENIGDILATIKLKNDTEIIMAEYALESYAEAWKEQFTNFDLIDPNVTYY